MSVSATRRFTVAEFDNQYVWLELREGEKRGLQFAVPRDNGCQEKLNGLNVGDHIEATLVSKNDRNTAWECVEVDETAEGNQRRVHADD